MKTARRCRELHELLHVVEFDALGATVSCLRCEDTFHITEDQLEERYYHYHHVSRHGPAEDMDAFILDTLIE